MGRFVNLSGREFGELSVIREDGRNKQGKALWLCQCSCGKRKTIYGYSLTSGHTISCGCVQKAKARQTLINIVNPNKYKIRGRRMRNVRTISTME